MSSDCDAIILGAGVVGAACAMECAQAGMRVAVVEGGIVGGGATAAGMGHIVVMDDSPAQLALTRYSQQLWQGLAPQLPAEAEYETTGTIWVAADDAEMREVARKRTLYEASGLQAHTLDQQQLLRQEPHLRPGLAGGLLVPSDAVLYPPAAADFLLKQAFNAGAWLVQQTAVRAGEGTLHLANGDTLTAPRLVNALGAWAAQITPDVPILPRKGHLAITDRAPGFVHHQLVELGYVRSAGTGTADSVAFNVQPRKTGQVLIGSSRQFNSQDKAIDHQVLQRMLRQTCSYLPEIDRLSILRIWTGFRAATPDKLPLIGPHPGDPTLYLATGHEGLGITTALATGKLLRHIFTGSGSQIPVEPYLPSRILAAKTELSNA